MSRKIIQCPGCLSKLRFEIRADRSELECPRCGEQIQLANIPEEVEVLDDDHSAAHTPVQPGPQDTAYTDEDTIAAKRDSMIFLGAVGIALLVALIAFPSAIYFLLGNDKDDQQVVQNEEDPDRQVERTSDSQKPNPPAQSDTSDQRPVDADQEPVETDRQPPVPPPNLPQNPEPDPGEEQAPVVADQNPEPQPQQPVPQPVEPAPVEPEDPPEVADAPPEDGNLTYRWVPNNKHVYALTVSADYGNTTEEITGTCTYTVQNEAQVDAQEQEGSGTGFVVGADGLIATCAHVIEGAKRIEVTIGEKKYVARTVVEDKRLDLALLRIKADNLPVIEFGDSDKVRLAEKLQALGYPMSTILGETIKVAGGSVAGFPEHPQHGRQIQTDAAINSGNSGGPLLNEAGQVVGIASSKIASRAASNVGFAVPANELRGLMERVKLPVPEIKDLPKLDAPDSVAAAQPSVAFIRVSGISPGKAMRINYTASFRRNQRMRRGGAFGVPRMPSFPDSKRATGHVTVTDRGEILDFDGDGSLPFVLGPIGRIFIEPLSMFGEETWSSESETTLRIVKQEANDPLSRMRNRAGFPRLPGIPGRAGFDPFDPFGERRQEEVVETFPAEEQSVFRLGRELNNRVTVHKKYSFTTTKNPERPYLSVSGAGDFVFDRALGVLASLDYKATVSQRDENGQVNRVPVTVGFTLRDPQELARERKAALTAAEDRRAAAEAQRAAAEERRAAAEREKATPNPELVQELLGSIRKAGGSIESYRHLQRLAQIAVAPEHRDQVMEVAENHVKNSNPLVSRVSHEVIAAWCSDDDTERLMNFARSTDSSLREARRRANARLQKLQPEGYIKLLVDQLTDFRTRYEAKKLLIGLGLDAEDACIEGLQQNDEFDVRRELLDVLRQVGTAKSIPAVEQFVSERRLKSYAQRALDGIRGRL